MAAPKNVTNKATTVQATTNPIVSPTIVAQQPVSPVVTPQGQVFLHPVSVSHPTLGKGFDSTMVEDTVETAGRKGRQAGTGMISDVVKNIEAYRNNPAMHGKSIRVGQFGSPSAAITMRVKLKKLHPSLVANAEVLPGKVVDETGKEIGSKLIYKYGIPVA